MNPELTYTTPPLPTACGTADIMMHTIERYFAPVDGNAATDALAEALLRTVIRFGPVALERPEDYEARSELMWCGSLSHTGLTGLGRPSDFSIHQLGHGLSGRYGVPHGMSLTILWQAWARPCGRPIRPALPAWAGRCSASERRTTGRPRRPPSVR